MTDRRPGVGGGVATEGLGDPPETLASLITHRSDLSEVPPMPRPGSSHHRGYGAAYRRARAALLAGSPPCHWCGAPATTADHEPPIQVAGRPHLQLVPACATCNYGRRSNTPNLGRSAPPSRDW